MIIPFPCNLLSLQQRTLHKEVLYVRFLNTGLLLCLSQHAVCKNKRLVFPLPCGSQQGQKEGRLCTSFLWDLGVTFVPLLRYYLMAELPDLEIYQVASF